MLTRTIIKSLNESHNPLTRSVRDDLTFTDEVFDSYRGELKARLTAYHNENIAGTIDYTHYNDKVYIDFINTVSPYERSGIATALIDYLVKDNKGYENILWGNTTEDGTALKNVMDQRYGKVDEKRIKRISRNLLTLVLQKDLMAGLFMKDLYDDGTKAFDKWESTAWIEEHPDLANDIAEITEWIDGSSFTFVGQRRPEQSAYVPDHIIPMIASRFKLKLKGS